MGSTPTGAARSLPPGRKSRFSAQPQIAPILRRKAVKVNDIVKGGVQKIAHLA